jgi:hypothetical protein
MIEFAILSPFPWNRVHFSTCSEIADSRDGEVVNLVPLTAFEDRHFLRVWEIALRCVSDSYMAVTIKVSASFITRFRMKFKDKL